jgi:hypothetical protein
MPLRALNARQHYSARRRRSALRISIRPAFRVAITTRKEPHLAERLPENGGAPGATHIAPHQTGQIGSGYRHATAGSSFAGAKKSAT